MNKPNTFIVGAPKCGTTSLYYYLKEHDSVFVPQIKEQHFFSQSEVKDTYYDVYFAKTIDEYLDNYKHSKFKKVLVDISPSYLLYKDCADKIKKFNPDSKVIIILRNPIERAISHYLMDLRIGYANKPLLFYLEDKKSKNYKEYVENSLYYEGIKHYKKVFKKNLLVLSFNDLIYNPNKLMNTIFSFLNLENIELDSFKKYNTYAQPTSLILYFLRKLNLYNSTKMLIPNFLKDHVKNLLVNKNIEKPQYINERKILDQIFKNDSKNLEQLLKKKFW